MAKEIMNFAYKNLFYTLIALYHAVKFYDMGPEALLLL
jgi:hypothetical protein